MTDKEFKRLKRSQLIDIIYQFQLKQEELEAENEKLTKELADKRLRIDKTGNIAEAALEVHDVMRSAQDAAEHYMEEIRLKGDQVYQQILQDAQNEATAIVAKAIQEAAKIIAKANPENSDYDTAMEAFLKEFGYDR